MERLCPHPGDSKTQDLTVGEVLRRFLSTVQQILPLGARVRRVLRRLAACGTFDFGAHVYECRHCHYRHCGPRSCGDRHCPQCLAAKSRDWLLAQKACLLPATYYHGVITLPPALHRLVQFNPTRLYPLLFDAASQALLQFGRNRLGGDLGITAVLHTWGQQMNFHPHLHCIIPGGALSPDGTRWRSPPQRQFLFPVRPLAILFRGKFLAGLQRLLQDPTTLRLPDATWKDPLRRARLIATLYQQRWHIYVKRPFGGPEQVLAYLANYTHRVAISNRRIQRIDPVARTVTFTWRNYRHGSKVQSVTLSALEFIRRFSWHILPPGLVRIRHYGFLGNNRRHQDVPKARALLVPQAQPDARPAPVAPTPVAASPAPRLCPRCGSPQVRWVGFIDARGQFHGPRIRILDSS